MEWLTLVIGNSRFHWAYFEDKQLQKTWHSNEPIIPSIGANLPLYLASVVPAKTTLFQHHPHLRIIELADIPLAGIYPTMGIDRALAIFGAMNKWGSPCLVIDGGTALTFTAADGDKLVGGAILPGLKLQLQALAKGTGALPDVDLKPTLPQLWAKETPEAIRSGVIYTILAGIKEFINNWWQEFPQSQIIFTGGDGQLLCDYLSVIQPTMATKVRVDPNLIFWGIVGCVNEM